LHKYFVTSESVTEGHPDKLCDQISDGILDAYLEKDPFSRVAVETTASCNTLFIAGEITSKTEVDIPAVAGKIARDIGYISAESGLDGHNCLIITNINSQSPDIAKGVILKELPVNTNVMPNVVGMGAKDAVFALENSGLRVSISGYGAVVSQSAAPGSRIVPGQTVTLTLK